MMPIFTLTTVAVVTAVTAVTAASTAVTYGGYRFFRWCQGEVVEAKGAVAKIANKVEEDIGDLKIVVGKVAGRTGQHVESVTTMMKATLAGGGGLVGMFGTFAIQKYICEDEFCTTITKIGGGASGLLLTLAIGIVGVSIFTSQQEKSSVRTTRSHQKG